MAGTTVGRFRRLGGWTVTQRTLFQISGEGTAGHASYYINVTAIDGASEWTINTDHVLSGNPKIVAGNSQAIITGTALNIATTGLLAIPLFPFSSGTILSGPNTAVPVCNQVDINPTTPGGDPSISFEIYAAEAGNERGMARFLLYKADNVAITTTVDIDNGPQGVAESMFFVIMQNPINENPAPTNDWGFQFNKRIGSEIITVAEDAAEPGQGARAIRLVAAFESGNLAIPIPDQVVLTKNSGTNLFSNIYCFVG